MLIFKSFFQRLSILLILILLFMLVQFAYSHTIPIIKRMEKPKDFTFYDFKNDHYIDSLSQKLKMQKIEGDIQETSKINKLIRNYLIEKNQKSPLNMNFQPPSNVYEILYDENNNGNKNFDWGDDILISYSSQDDEDPRVVSEIDGTLYCVYGTEDNAYQYYWIKIRKSEDRGLSWEDFGGCYSTNGNMYFYDVAIGEGTDDRLYVLYERNGNIYCYSKPLSGGLGTFSTIDASSAYKDAYSICVDTDTYYFVYVIYLYSNDGTVFFCRSTDFGGSWEDYCILSGDGHDGADIHYGWSGLWAAYLDGLDYNSDTNIQCQKSTNYGLNWSGNYQISYSGHNGWPQIVAAKYNSTVLSVYCNRYSTSDYDIYYSYTNNGGTNWTCDGYVDFTIESSKYPYLAYGSDYRLIWWETDYSIHYTYANTFPNDPWQDEIQIDDANHARNYRKGICEIGETGGECSPYAVWEDDRDGNDNVYGDSFENPSQQDLQSNMVIPEKFALNSPIPNPFNPATELTFELPISCDVSFIVYDLQGCVVTLLADGSFSPGIYKVKFDASCLSSGIYFARLWAGEFAGAQKLLLIK